MGLGRHNAQRVHALRAAGLMDDQRIMAMLDLVVAPATPHDGELGGDHPRVARGCDLAFELRTGVPRHVAAACGAIHTDDGRRVSPQIGRDAPS